jgi:non-homologous end joining protein Ku
LVRYWWNNLDLSDISNYSDAYTKELEKLIQAKNQGKLHIVKEEEESKETIKDLREALKASVSKSVLVQNQNTNNNNQKQNTTNHVTKRVQRKEEFQKDS